MNHNKEVLRGLWVSVQDPTLVDWYTDDASSSSGSSASMEEDRERAA